MSVGHSPSEAQWAPDMRKSEQDITEEDKREAKRRIQGSVLMQDSPDDSNEEDGMKRRQSIPPTINTLAASSM